MKTTADKNIAPEKGGLGLEKSGDVSANLASPKNAANMGGPLELDISLIDEDSHQPRTRNNPGFGDESLSELAASICLRGVKTPISVRDNPKAPGRYLINHGARRFRASQRADKTTIPGFIDNDYNEADQVVENLQRNELTAREIADFIGRELAKGVKRGEIARIISKSPAFVTQHAALLDLPDPIAQAFNSSRVKDVTLVNELITAFKKKPLEVTNWLEDKHQEITRGSVKMLREFLENKQQRQQEQLEGEEDMSDSIVTLTGMAEADASESKQDPGADFKKAENELQPDKLKKAIVQVLHNGRSARLILNRRPPAKGFAWLKYEDDGQEFEANLSSVTLVALLEG
ncbi:MAG: chromosome partitioning protein ParB [Arthrobacter sp.]|nr:chromosome partitioning protein ParB [Arthrobacter sp.]